jgi:hypothetical protein
MSQFYDLSSLVVIPSGYKASTIYAQKPLTTDGQLSFTRASTATRVNASGLIEEVASGVPRLDYLGSTCPKLLLEPQRTNDLTYSEDFTNAAWFKDTGCTATGNNTAAPTGATTADKLEASASNALNVYQLNGSVLTATYTYSVFLKKGNTTTWDIYIFQAGFVSRARVNFDTGTITNVVGSGATVTNYGNGWYRCTITASLLFGTTASFGIYNEDTTGTRNVYAWGAMEEAGAYATSYVKTEAAAVTRVADAASKTGISSLIGQTEGTLFAEIYPEEFINGSYLGISDGANIANRIIFGFEGGSANSGFFQVYGASGLNGSGLYTRGQRMKVAIGYKSGNSALYVNGNLVDAVTTTFTTTLTKFGFDSFAGTQNFVGRCSQALLFKTRLTNAQLAELTAL